MKILFLNHNIRGRGTWFRCWHLAQGLANRGHEVTLITLTAAPSLRGRKERTHGVTVIEAPRWLPQGRHDGGWAPLDVLYRLGPALRTRWDVVHAFGHRPNISIPWMMARWLRRARVAAADWDDWWCRGGILEGRRRFRFLDTLEASWLEEGTKKKADLLTVVGRVLHERALAIGVPEKRILVVPQGADTRTIGVADKGSCRKQYGFEPEGLVLGFVGFALWDLRSLLEAFGRVRQSIPDARLFLVGKDKDGILPRLREEFAFGPELCELGTQPPDRLGEILGAADVLMLPMEDSLANRARAPIKLGDYLAAGRPVVVGDVGETGSLVREHGVGLAVRPGPENYAEAVKELAEDPDRLRSLGERARRVAEEKMTWARSVHLLELAYRNLLGLSE